MKLIRRAEATDRNFASKVFCFNAGYEQVKDTRYDIIGNLDADLSFDKDYFEYLLEQFARNPELGVAGTLFVEEASTHYDYRFANIDHVFGGCQMFRRQCFEAIGGYLPIKGGGIDWVAVTTARMKGWKTRTFTDKTAFHHRRMGTGKGGVLSAKFRLGREDYSLGSHPLWALLRAFYPAVFHRWQGRSVDVSRRSWARWWCGLSGIHAGLSELAGYQEALRSGQESAIAGLNASGRLNSGGALKALQTYGQDYENQRSGDYLTRLMGLSGMGQQATGQQVATAGQGLQGQLGARTTAYGGDMNAAGTVGQGMIAGANAEQGALGNLLGAAPYLGGAALGGGGTSLANLFKPQQSRQSSFSWGGQQYPIYG